MIKIQERPFHDDVCGHGIDAYVCTFWEWEKQAGGIQAKMAYDLYVYNELDGQHVCIRCSSEGSDYISGGTVGEFLRQCDGKPGYRATAARILLERGTLTWRRK